jgi:ATP-binding cassette subfamily B (MDR/TAP) protein 1
MTLICRHNVELRYPSRPGVLSLAGVSIHMERGKSYAFCGTSGAGKSSILAVLQRFYNITSGSITLDGKDIRAMDVKEYRNMMGYVSQEPVLFEETIRWNLLVCLLSPLKGSLLTGQAGAINPETITQADMEYACEQARILDFIKSLPEGFETDIGLKGGQLSGGQRQRICIARALLRKPRILLLDGKSPLLESSCSADSL